MNAWLVADVDKGIQADFESGKRDAGCVGEIADCIG